MSATEQLCTRGDLRVDAVMTVAVDDRGLPVHDVPCADPVEEQPYWCVTCDKTFDHFGLALLHLASTDRRVEASV